MQRTMPMPAPVQADAVAGTPWRSLEKEYISAALWQLSITGKIEGAFERIRNFEYDNAEKNTGKPEAGQPGYK